MSTAAQLHIYGVSLSIAEPGPRRYHDSLTVSVNRKGVIDVDTVKGCTFGMRAYPDGGCYGECYAARIAKRNGIAFEHAVSRTMADVWQHRDVLIKQLLDQPAPWYRVGVMGDPCHDWAHTVRTVRALRPAKKTPVIITKHWVPLADEQISRLVDTGAVIHTSVSGMDTGAELRHRLAQWERLRSSGLTSILRVVTCDYGDTIWGLSSRAKQEHLLSLAPVIDNPLRARSSSPRVLSGDIRVTRRADSVGGGRLVSLHAATVYLGHCKACPDQCGVKGGSVVKKQQKSLLEMPEALPDEQMDYVYVKSVIGSGYEQDVAKLALEDGIAHRAARKNMQIHSAVIALHQGAFAGFMTFQDNRDLGEFCLLQSVIKPALHTPERYARMVEEVLAHNTAKLPALMTTNPKSKFETPRCFEAFGFHTYLKMSGFHYMCTDPEYSRIKTLAHITMTNVWDSVKGEWLRLKKDWNARLELAGAREKIPNPTFASREGCWQGESGFANVVTGRSHNGNASVLDPVACEVILRFFMSAQGRRVYNPFGGGVQFGYVTGAAGFEYLASEIRKNQCDANNALCSEFKGRAKWVQSDSSTYEPKGMFDLVFTCPPYYRVEKYVDYDGKSPDGEINSLPSYEAFRDTLFAGYKRAIEKLNDNRFFVVMTGDSRDSKGAYHAHEAETVVFLKEQGLSIYNQIVYLEAEFTRLAQAKKTLHLRKFPKREQKIIVAYKGKIAAIKDEFRPIGRL